MGLPFLKNREGSAAAPVETIEREHDEGFDFLGAVADDMLDALKKGDRALLKDTLGALCDYIQDQDVEQDELLAGEPT